MDFLFLLFELAKLALINVIDIFLTLLPLVFAIGTVALILAVTEGRYEPQTPVSTETKESEVTENVFIGVGVAVLLVGLFLTFGLKR